MMGGREVLGIWLHETERARFWLAALNEPEVRAAARR